jgi:hypothetical protein
MWGEVTRPIGSRAAASRRCAWCAWCAGILVGIFASGCGGASTKRSAPASVDPFEALPTFDVELAREIARAEQVSPEAISLRDELLELHDLEGVQVFSKTGELLGSNSGRPALGTDAFSTSDGERVSVLVLDQSLVWSGPFEPGAVILEGVTSATGLGIGFARNLCEGCIYVADGPALSVAEYVETRKADLAALDPPDAAVRSLGRAAQSGPRARPARRASSAHER